MSTLGNVFGQRQLETVAKPSVGASTRSASDLSQIGQAITAAAQTVGQIVQGRTRDVQAESQQETLDSRVRLANARVQEIRLRHDAVEANIQNREASERLKQLVTDEADAFSRALVGRTPTEQAEFLRQFPHMDPSNRSQFGRIVGRRLALDLRNRWEEEDQPRIESGEELGDDFISSMMVDRVADSALAGLPPEARAEIQNTAINYAYSTLATQRKSRAQMERAELIDDASSSFVADVNTALGGIMFTPFAPFAWRSVQESAKALVMADPSLANTETSVQRVMRSQVDKTLTHLVSNGLITHDQLDKTLDMLKDASGFRKVREEHMFELKSLALAEQEALVKQGVAAISDGVKASTKTLDAQIKGINNDGTAGTAGGAVDNVVGIEASADNLMKQAERLDSVAEKSEDPEIRAAAITGANDLRQAAVTASSTTRAARSADTAIDLAMRDPSFRGGTLTGSLRIPEGEDDVYRSVMISKMPLEDQNAVGQAKMSLQLFGRMFDDDRDALVLAVNSINDYAREFVDTNGLPGQPDTVGQILARVADIATISESAALQIVKDSETTPGLTELFHLKLADPNINLTSMYRAAFINMKAMPPGQLLAELQAVDADDAIPLDLAIDPEVAGVAGTGLVTIAGEHIPLTAAGIPVKGADGDPFVGRFGNVRTADIVPKDAGRMFSHIYRLMRAAEYTPDKAAELAQAYVGKRFTAHVIDGKGTMFPRAMGVLSDANASLMQDLVDLHAEARDPSGSERSTVVRPFLDAISNLIADNTSTDRIMTFNTGFILDVDQIKNSFDGRHNVWQVPMVRTEDYGELINDPDSSTPVWIEWRSTVEKNTEIGWARRMNTIVEASRAAKQVSAGVFTTTGPGIAVPRIEDLFSGDLAEKINFHNLTLNDLIVDPDTRNKLLDQSNPFTKLFK